jgi:hypothetical protein
MIVLFSMSWMIPTEATENNSLEKTLDVGSLFWEQLLCSKMAGLGLGPGTQVNPLMVHSYLMLNQW